MADVTPGQINRKVITIPPGSSTILPPDANIVSVVNFDGGIADSNCPLPTSTGTETFYYFIPQEWEDSNGFADIVEFRYGGNSHTYPLDTRVVQPAGSIAQTSIKDPIKATPGILQMRFSNNNNTTNNQWFSLTVPAGGGFPYIKLDYKATGAGFRTSIILASLQPGDQEYANAVANLSNPNTII